MEDTPVLDDFEVKPQRGKILTLPLRISIAIIIIGVSFKIMHWPGAIVVMLSGCAAIIIMYPIRFFYKQEKKIIDYVKLALVVFWVVAYVFRVMHYPFAEVLSIIAQVAFGVWVIMSAVGHFSENKKNTKRNHKKIYSIIFYVLGGMLLLVGAAFKIMHWHGGLHMILTGGFILLVWVIVDGIINAKNNNEEKDS